MDQSRRNKLAFWIGIIQLACCVGILALNDFTINRNNVIDIAIAGVLGVFFISIPLWNKGNSETDGLDDAAMMHLRKLFVRKTWILGAIIMLISLSSHILLPENRILSFAVAMALSLPVSAIVIIKHQNEVKNQKLKVQSQDRTP